MNEYLHALNQTRRPFAPCLYFSQIVHRDPTAPQYFREKLRRRDRILDGKIDPNAACRRHRVRSVADTKQSFAAPITQTIDLYRKQLDLRPIAQLRHTVAEKSGEGGDVVLKLRQPTRFNLAEAAFRDDEAALPIIATIEQH